MYCDAELENDRDGIQKYEQALTPEDISTWFSESNPLVLYYLTPLSLGFMNLYHPLRWFCVRIMLSIWFERVILASIIVNALFLAADNPLVDSHALVSDFYFVSVNYNLRDVLTSVCIADLQMFLISEIIFNSIFLVEFFIKLFAFGGFDQRSGYFRDPWNR